MITEDYVSLETARLLKEKEFDEPCYLGYNRNGDYIPTANRRNSQIIQPDFCLFCCPTIQMAMKWLREVHQLCILPTLSSECRHTYAIYRLHSNYPIELRLSEEFGESYNKQEPACEAAIKYCLENLI